MEKDFKLNRDFKLFSLRAFRRGDLCSGLSQAQGLLLFQAALLDGERRRRALPTLWHKFDRNYLLFSFSLQTQWPLLLPPLLLPPLLPLILRHLGLTILRRVGMTIFRRLGSSSLHHVATICEYSHQFATFCNMFQHFQHIATGCNISQHFQHVAAFCNIL